MGHRIQLTGRGILVSLLAIMFLCFASPAFAATPVAVDDPNEETNEDISIDYYSTTGVEQVMDGGTGSSLVLMVGDSTAITLNGDNVPSSTSNKLYNDGSDLYWSGCWVPCNRQTRDVGLS